MESENELVTAKQLENLDKIFDRNRPVKTREEIIRLAELTDEGEEFPPVLDE